MRRSGPNPGQRSQVGPPAFLLTLVQHFREEGVSLKLRGLTVTRPDTFLEKGEHEGNKTFCTFFSVLVAFSGGAIVSSGERAH